jgi:hypothetical protein
MEEMGSRKINFTGGLIMKKLLAVLLAVILILGITACGNSNISVTPLMWQVTSPSGQTMYLFGSIHAGIKDIYPLPDVITDAFLWADYLAVEMDIIAFSNNTAAQEAIAAMMTYSDGRTITDDIDPELVELMKTVIAEELGITPDEVAKRLDKYKPYEWYSTLTMLALERSNLSYDFGLDMFFLREAYGRGMTILEIESAEFQLGMFHDFSNELMEIFLVDLLDIRLNADSLNDLFRMWRRGNERVLNEYIKPDYYELFGDDYDEYFEDYDEFMYYIELINNYNDVMLTQRDIGMAAAASRYMADGKNVFFVVGLAHLIGENSVVDLLRQQGYTVEIIPTR